MAKRRVSTCKREKCTNRFISEGRGRPRLYCSDACKQADQRLKAKERNKIKLELTEEELADFQAVTAVKPEALTILSRIETLCGESALVESIRLINLFAPVKLTVGATK